MKVLIKSTLFTAISLVLCAAVLCAAILLTNPGGSPLPSVQTTPFLLQTSSPIPTVVTRPTTVPVVTTSTPTVPATTIPVTTVPVTTTPATTVPVTTVPATTAPATTVPTTTVPPATVPVTTAPPETVPVITVPPTTLPAVTAPPATVPPVTVPAVPTPNSSLDARSAFVYDCNSDTLLCAKGDMTARLHPASITKLFTIYTAYQYLDPSQTITVGTIIQSVPQDSSFAYVETGDVLTLEDLIAAMLLPSGNDAAMVMAVAAGRVIAQDPALAEKAALSVFMDEMNRQTEVLGLTDSHFSCPDGYYNQDHYSCMADLLTIAKHCLAIPEIRKIAASPEYTYVRPDGRSLTWKNTNWLVREDKEFQNAYAIGLKTGYTSAAGNCLLSAFHIDGRDLIIGVFGCSSVRNRFDDTTKLFNEFA